MVATNWLMLLANSVSCAAFCGPWRSTAGRSSPFGSRSKSHSILAACIIGIPAGTLLSQPLLANSSQALGLAYIPSFSVALDLLTLAGVLVLIVLAATLPALRAGLLNLRQ